MTRASKLMISCFVLCAGTALFAQQATPESKGETTPQQTPAQQPQAAVRAPLRIRVSRGVSEAMIAKKVQPEYPEEAREAHLQGEVVLRIIISREGDVSKVVLISGHPLLAGAAIDAVKQWKYKPYLLDSNPIEVDTEAVVAFSLQGIIKQVPSDDAAPATGTGVVGEAPGGVPAVETNGMISGIIRSTPPKPRVAVPPYVRVSQGVSRGLLVKKVDPEYPPEARRGRVEGTVVLHVLISKAGDVATVELVSGDPMLAPAAIDAVKQWKYKPYLLHEEPVAVDTQITVNFTLAN
jgi:TonB family protein